MPNVLEYAKIFQQELDKQVVAQATSGWMEDNAGLVKYNGGNEVKIPVIEMDALGDYDRANGFVEGSVNLTYETKIMTMDRGRTFMLDRMDVDETNFVATAANVMGEFQRTKVIPEIDAYRYSSIASQAIEKGAAVGGYTPSESDILKKLKEDIYAIYDVAGEIPLVIIMNMQVAAILENSTELSKTLSVIDFTQGDIKTSVRAIDNNPIIKVPSARMKTKYVFYDGKTAGQEAGGFTPAEDAKNINWIICPRTAPIAVSKTDNIRIFTPEQNQKADAWKIDYRKYHDLWIKDNQFKAIRVNIKEALA
ncbi:prophage protein [Thermoclostridium stercorarium subsp. stercorarium DSM 8532]|uniref:Prophage protein n=1 Tax=Thermoclostridium stercorarium (strain ATCC 35414 / DSM 8532 / NCIMB 11754) TaxID=1121335 RepID=L7VPD8_THES1|nr:hypothetical protein [Thermoclostridium stercorarium]AGC67433.1 prophage protein [Thermoclostridium stercorarium subsp. stercorarium DSM 8532]AGI38493.1 hypothetical protein Clst_0392 [Thermoclostridium stercorarium subsp. stercorarium DSM 8532]